MNGLVIFWSIWSIPANFQIQYHPDKMETATTERYESMKTAHKLWDYTPEILTVRPGKMMIGRQSFPLKMVPFHKLAVKLRGCKPHQIPGCSTTSQLTTVDFALGETPGFHLKKSPQPRTFSCPTFCCASATTATLQPLRSLTKSCMAWKIRWKTSRCEDIFWGYL